MSDTETLVMPKRWGRCSVCRSEHADAIEVMCLNGRSFKRNVELLNRVYNINLKPEGVRYHMLNHVEPDRMAKMQLIIDIGKAAYGDAFNIDDVDVEAIRLALGVLVYDVVSKVMNSDIKVNSLSDALRVIAQADMVKSSEHKQAMDERRLEMEQGSSINSTEDAFRQLGYIMQAMKTVAKTQDDMDFIHNIIMQAFSLGLGEDVISLGELSIYQLSDDWVDVDMSGAVSEAKALGTYKPTAQLAQTEAVLDVPPDE